MIKLSPIAIRVCESNYAKNCGSCPLRPVCCRPIGVGQEKINQWTQAVNEFAENVRIEERDEP